jgi:co-chaperonin GroES (HSP10)
MRLKPIDTTIAVEIEKVSGKSSGGIQLLEDAVLREQMSITEGVLAAVGDYAFCDIKDGLVPKIGDKIFFKRHSGILHTDKETGKEYRIIQDTDVYAIEQAEEVNNG